MLLLVTSDGLLLCYYMTLSLPNAPSLNIKAELIQGTERPSMHYVCLLQLLVILQSVRICQMPAIYSPGITYPDVPHAVSGTVMRRVHLSHYIPLTYLLTFFRTYLLPYLSASLRIGLFHFQFGGRKRRPNLPLVFFFWGGGYCVVVYFVMDACQLNQYTYNNSVFPTRGPGWLISRVGMRSKATTLKWSP